MATISGKKSELREILKNEYVKTALLIVILVGAMVSFWFGIKAVLRTETPFMTVVTGSMVPTLNIGDLIIVQGYPDPSAIYVAPKPNGDIIVFLHWSSAEGVIHLVHRAIGEKIQNGKRYLLTRGDYSETGYDYHYNLTTHVSLPGLPEEYVVGKVVANVPVIGNIALFLQTLEGRILIIGLFVVILIVEFYPFSKKKNKEQVPEHKQVEA